MKNAGSQEKIRELEEAAKPRTISDAQKTIIANLLRPFAGEKVEVRLYAQEHEAQVFASLVVETLAKAGLKPSLNTIMGATGQGFGIAVHDAKSAPPLAGTIQHAFGAAGITVAGIARPKDVPEGKFFVFIGVKPSEQ